MRVAEVGPERLPADFKILDATAVDIGIARTAGRTRELARLGVVITGHGHERHKAETVREFVADRAHEARLIVGRGPVDAVVPALPAQAIGVAVEARIEACRHVVDGVGNPTAAQRVGQRQRVEGVRCAASLRREIGHEGRRRGAGQGRRGTSAGETVVERRLDTDRHAALDPAAENRCRIAERDAALLAQGLAVVAAHRGRRRRVVETVVGIVADHQNDLRRARAGAHERHCGNRRHGPAGARPRRWPINVWSARIAPPVRFRWARCRHAPCAGCRHRNARPAWRGRRRAPA